MLSVRLPDPLENQLASYCVAAGLSKSAVVQAALEKHLKKEAVNLAANLAAGGNSRRASKDPFLALIGSGNRKYSTDQIMRMTRGTDWNKR